MAEVTVRASQRVEGLAPGDEVRVEETPRVKRLIEKGSLELLTRHRGPGKPADKSESEKPGDGDSGDENTGGDNTPKE